MIHDELNDPKDPLSARFQDRMLERGKRLEALRSLVATNSDAAAEFQALVTEQLQAYEQLVQASHRFPPGKADSPAEIFRRAMAGEIKKLRDDADAA
jgi:hypothetical protein